MPDEVRPHAGDTGLPASDFGALASPRGGSEIYRLTTARFRNPLPPGAVVVGAGLLVNGITTYAFLVAARRALGEAGYEPFAVLWGLVFILGPGLFQPLQQEMTRATAARASRGIGSAPVLRRAALVGAGELALVSVAVAIWWQLGLEGLLDSKGGLGLALIFALVGAAVGELVRGVLSGRQWFGAYAQSLSLEGLTRLVLAVGLIVTGLDSAGSLGGALGVSFLVAAMVVALTRRPFVQDGPEAEWSELTPSLGLLMVASLSEAFLLNVGPVAVAALSDVPGDSGRLLNGLIIARLPLFFFQAVKASLLPALVAMAAIGDMVGFRHVLYQLLRAVTAVAAIGIPVMAVLGPWAVELLFGDEVGHRDMGLLATASLGLMVVVSLSLALISLGENRLAVIGWLMGVLAFWPALAIGDDPFLQVELALIIGSGSAGVVFAVEMAAVLKIRTSMPDTGVTS